MEKQSQSTPEISSQDSPLQQSAFDGGGGMRAAAPAFQLQADSSAPIQRSREESFMDDPKTFMTHNIVHQDLELGIKNFYGLLQVRQPGLLSKFMGAAPQMEAQPIDAARLRVQAMPNILNYLKQGIRDYALAQIKAPDAEGKNGVFALTPLFSAEQAAGFGIPNGEQLIRTGACDKAIPAYFIPFTHDVDKIESTVIDPALGPEAARFAFTPGMNGCAMQVDENADGTWEATHFPNVSTNQETADARKGSASNKLWHGEEDYSGDLGDFGPTEYPSANVMLHNTGDGWQSVSQEKVYDSATDTGRITRVSNKAVG